MYSVIDLILIHMLTKHDTCELVLLLFNDYDLICFVFTFMNIIILDGAVATAVDVQVKEEPTDEGW